MAHRDSAARRASISSRSARAPARKGDALSDSTISAPAPARRATGPEATQASSQTTTPTGAPPIPKTGESPAHRDEPPLLVEHAVVREQFFHRDAPHRAGGADRGRVPQPAGIGHVADDRRAAAHAGRDGGERPPRSPRRSPAPATGPRAGSRSRRARGRRRRRRRTPQPWPARRGSAGCSLRSRRPPRRSGRARRSASPRRHRSDGTSTARGAPSTRPGVWSGSWGLRNLSVRLGRSRPGNAAER